MWKSEKLKKQNETDLSFSYGRLQTTVKPQYCVKVHRKYNWDWFVLSQKLGFELMTSVSFRSRLQHWIWPSEHSQPPVPVALQYFSMIQKCQLKVDSGRRVYSFPANCNPISLFRRVTAVFAVVLEQAAAVRAIVRITPSHRWEKQTKPREKCGTGSYSNSRTTDYRNFTKFTALLLPHNRWSD